MLEGRCEEERRRKEGGRCCTDRHFRLGIVVELHFSQQARQPSTSLSKAFFLLLLLLHPTLTFRERPHVDQDPVTNMSHRRRDAMVAGALPTVSPLSSSIIPRRQQRQRRQQRPTAAKAIFRSRQNCTTATTSSWVAGTTAAIYV